MYSLESALACWNDVGQYGSIEERLARGRLWLPYYSHLAKKAMNRPYQPSAQAAYTAEFLLRENLLRPGDSLLDIGAGMGEYSLEFARRRAAVTALDMNPDSLEVLKRRAAQCCLSGMQCVNAPWETYAPAGKFDVTFSAMCPAVCDQEALLRLENMTRRTACLLTVTRGSYEKNRMELLRQLPLKKPGGMVTEALHYYNVLYLMGRQPGVKCWSECFRTTTRMDELIERYVVYLKIFGMEEAASRPFLRDFFSEKAVDGMVEDECRMNYALVYWDVSQRLKNLQ